LAPLDWAVMRDHADVIKALVEAGAEGTDTALHSAAARGQVEIVRAILAKARPKEAALTRALAATPVRHKEVAEWRRKAGAKPPAKTEAAAGRDLAAYAGTYRGAGAAELTIAVEGDKLTARSGTGPATKLNTTDKVAFKSEDGAVTVTFRREAGKV